MIAYITYTMNKLFTLSIVLFFFFSAQAQCVIDTTIQTWGFHPDTGSVLKHACAGSQYDETIQIFAPETVTISLGTFSVNYVQLDSMQGLPASLAYSTNPVSGYMAGGQRGCINIFGPVDAPAGVYEFTIFYTANFNVFGNPASFPFRAPYKIQVDSGGVATFGEFSDTTCSNSPYLYNNQWFAVTGDYNDTISNQAGCDSIITLHLTVETIDTALTTNGDSIIAPLGYVSYTLVNCNTDSALSTGSNHIMVVPDFGSYKIAISNGECTDTSGCVEFVEDTIPTGVPVHAVDRFKLYPNVAGNSITVETGSNSGVLNVYNQTGVLVMQIALNTAKQLVDISALAGGVYIAELKGENALSRKRFVKTGN